MMQNHRKAFVSWSGGKDSALAFYNAMKNSGMRIAYLLNMLSENGTHSRSHHLTVVVLKAQTEEVIPLLTGKPAELQLVLTGRCALPVLIKLADLVSNIQNDKGVKRRKGIEY